MIRRSFDADLVNKLVNDPTIRPFVGGVGELDLSAAVADDKNFILLGEHGGFLAAWSAPDTYEIHTFILPEGRGKAAADLAQELLAYLKATDAKHIWTRVAREQANVRRFTLAAGLEPCGEQTCDFGAGPVLYDLFHWRA